MSTLLRILIMAAAWLVFFLATFYGCIKPECCDNGVANTTQGSSTAVPPPPPTPITDDYTLATTTTSGEVTTGRQWTTQREGLLAKYRSDTSQTLQVVGNYYADEPTPTDAENLGMARANEVIKLLAQDIPTAKMKAGSRQLSGTTPPAEQTWLAASFDWTGGDAGAEAEVIQLSDREFKIRFPFNSGTGDLSPQVTQYLASLAEQLKKPGTTVALVGHTDDFGSPAANRELGLRRAEFVKQQLTAAGAPPASISTSSEGETAPEYPNDSEGNRYNNRRVVITMTED